MSEIHEEEARSFRAKDGYVPLFADEEGEDLIVSIPMWMFEKMANKLLTVKGTWS